MRFCLIEVSDEDRNPIIGIACLYLGPMTKIVKRYFAILLRVCIQDFLIVQIRVF